MSLISKLCYMLSDTGRQVRQLQTASVGKLWDGTAAPGIVAWLSESSWETTVQAAAITHLECSSVAEIPVRVPPTVASALVLQLAQPAVLQVNQRFESGYWFEDALSLVPLHATLQQLQAGTIGPVSVWSAAQLTDALECGAVHFCGDWLVATLPLSAWEGLLAVDDVVSVFHHHLRRCCLSHPHQA
jgi:hypothetical protein